MSTSIISAPKILKTMRIYVDFTTAYQVVEVSYGTQFSAPPMVIATVVSGTGIRRNMPVISITSATTTGCTLHLWSLTNETPTGSPMIDMILVK